MPNFRIQHRVMSPDVIERKIVTNNKERWEVYIAPLGNRHDNIAHEIIKFLEKNLHSK